MENHDGKGIAVIYASKHGSTREIAEGLQRVLSDRGLRAELCSVEDGVDLSGFDAVVLGSAVYMGRWLKSAREFAEARGDELTAKPLWLFSSGPIGSQPEPKDDPFGLAELAEKLGAREHRVFAGKIDKSQLGFAERAVLKAVRAEEGDSRDWDEIRAWAWSIAEALQQDGMAAEKPAQAVSSG